MHVRRHWRLCFAVGFFLLGPIVFAMSAFGLMKHDHDAPSFFAIAVLPPLLVIGFVMLAQLELNSGLNATPKGDLEELLLAKQRGHHGRCRRGYRLSMTPISLTSETTFATTERMPPRASTLDRLLQAKHRAGIVK